MGLWSCIYRWLGISLHRKRVETAVDHRNCAGDESRSIGDEILNSTAKLLRIAKTLEWCLTYHIGSTLGQRSGRIGEKRTVLVGDEETRSDGIDTNRGGKFSGNLLCPTGCEVGYNGFGGGINAHTCHGAESRHG